MKKKLSIVLISMMLITSCTTNPIDVLKKSYAKCQEVQNGYYEMTRYVKYTGDSDTSVSTYTCFFNKINGDTLSSSAFHNTETFANSPLESTMHHRENLYTGNEFVIFSEDSSAEIIAKDEWPIRVATGLYGSALYTPFTDRMSKPLCSDSESIKQKMQLTLLAPETVLGNKCFHLQIKKNPLSDSSNYMKVLEAEYHVWIRKEDYLPVQYSTYTRGLIYNDTVVQYEKFVLTNFELNSLKDLKMLTLQSIPANYRIEKFKGIHTLPQPQPTSPMP